MHRKKTSAQNSNFGHWMKARILTDIPEEVMSLRPKMQPFRAAFISQENQ